MKNQVEHFQALGLDELKTCSLKRIKLILLEL